MSRFKKFMHSIKMELIGYAEPKSELVRTWTKEIENVQVSVSLYKLNDTTFVSEKGDRQRFGIIGYFLVDIPSKHFRSAVLVNEKKFSMGDYWTWREFSTSSFGPELLKRAFLMAEKAIGALKR